MALERDLELLDDYISHRMSGEQRAEFEQRMKQDPLLQSEYTFQQQIADGLRKARAAELKQMLRNIPVSELTPNRFSKLKWAGAALLIITGSTLYWHFARPIETGNAPASATQTIEEIPANEPAEKQEQANITPPPSENSENPVAQPAVQERQNQTKPAPASAPVKPNVYDPTEEENVNEQPVIENPAVSHSPSGTSSVTTEVVTTDRKYTFHYDVSDDRLVLYGPFEKNLYEILEFFSENGQRTMFLFYKESYFLLQEEKPGVKPLVPVNDPALLKKLREYRNK